VPEFDSITGLPPAVALQQQRGAPSARSSVGSVTTISNSLRMLYSRAGSYPPRQPMLYAEDFSPNTVQGGLPSSSPKSSPTVPVYAGFHTGRNPGRTAKQDGT